MKLKQTEILLGNRKGQIDTVNSSISAVHIFSHTIAVFSYRLFTYKQTPLPWDFPVTEGSRSSRRGAPKTSKDNSVLQSFPFNQVSVGAIIIQPSLYSRKQSTFACSSFILVHKDCTFARIMLGSGIHLNLSFFNLSQIPPRFPLFLTFILKLKFSYLVLPWQSVLQFAAVLGWFPRNWSSNSWLYCIG